MGTLTHTTAEVELVVNDDLEQYGAAGYLVAPATIVLDGTNWASFTTGTFTIPFASGFEYVSGSTIRYTNGARWFLLSGNINAQSGVNSTYLEFGAEKNGTYVPGSTTGDRFFSLTTDKGSLSFSIPVYMEEDDTLGLVCRSTDSAQTATVNGWQSSLGRF